MPLLLECEDVDIRYSHAHPLQLSSYVYLAARPPRARKNIGGQGGWGILRWILHRLFGYAHRSSRSDGDEDGPLFGWFRDRVRAYRLVWQYENQGRR
jgi:hypothetical protein